MQYGCYKYLELVAIFNYSRQTYKIHEWLAKCRFNCQVRVHYRIFHRTFKKNFAPKESWRHLLYSSRTRQHRNTPFIETVLIIIYKVMLTFNGQIDTQRKNIRHTVLITFISRQNSSLIGRFNIQNGHVTCKALCYTLKSSCT